MTLIVEGVSADLARVTPEKSDQEWSVEFSGRDALERAKAWAAECERRLQNKRERITTADERRAAERRPTTLRISEISFQIRALERHVELLGEVARSSQQAVGDARTLLVHLHAALEESVKLQSHYAELLNMHDGGHRLTFADADAWLTRLLTPSENRQ
jgi:hypothetical protein